MRRRQGFTLVEMLVSMALTIFVLVIISQAFVAALETFRQLKAIGDMESAMRNATTILRNDLAQDHFEAKRRLSDPSFWTVGPPRQGFFRLLQIPVVNEDAMVVGNKLTYVNEGTDADGLLSRRRVGHILQFTNKSRGNRPEHFYAASIGDPFSPLLAQTFGQADSRYEVAANAPAAPLPATYKTFNSQWNEVAYFLVKTGANANGTDLYALYRRQRLAVPDNYAVNWTNIVAAPGNGKAQLAAYSQISCEVHAANNNVKPPIPQRLYFNNPTDLTVPERRFAPFGLFTTAFPPAYPVVQDVNGNATGADLLLTSVVSFDVQISVQPGVFGDLPALAAPARLATILNQPLVNAQMFDTWSTVQDDVYKQVVDNTTNPPKTYSYADPSDWPVWATQPPSRLVIRAVQITIRVWDAKTEQSRQVTIIQDM